MKKNIKTILFILVLSLFVFPNTIFAKTITLKKDTVMKTQLTGDNITITGKHKLTLKKGAKVKGNLVIKGGATVVSSEPGISAKNITISGATVKSKKTTYGGAISAENKVTINNSTIFTEATNYGDYGILGKKGITINNSHVEADINGFISIAGISSDEFVKATDSRIVINTIGAGISSFNDDIILDNVRGSITSGSSGISSNKKATLTTCDMVIIAGTESAGMGEEPDGIWAFDTVTIDGGSIVVSSELASGIYANELIDIKSGTELLSATGKEYGLEVWYNAIYGHGNITYGDNLTIKDYENVVFNEVKGTLEDGDGYTLKTARFEGPITKKENNLSVNVSNKTVSFKALKKKAQTVSAISIGRKNGTVTYTKLSGSSNKLSINKTTGKITVKKKTKKGTYKIKVRVDASGDKFYLSGSKEVTVTIKVK